MIIIAVTLLFIVPFYRASAQSSKYYNVTRLAGQDRYETSFFIASQVNPGMTNSVILASGKDFPDALAGAPLSKKLNAPILLVDDFIYGNSYENLDYIKKHLSKDGTIYLLGGESSINSNVVNELEQQGYTNIKRLGGENRFDTNGNIIDEMNVDEGTPVVIVNGFNFPDALSISSIAASKGYPIFMSQDNFSFQLNGYDKLEMYSNNFNKSRSVDLTNDEYMQDAKENGTEVQTYISDGPIYGLYSINDDLCGLKMNRYISGVCHANSIGGFVAYYKYGDGGMKLTDLDLNSSYPMTEIK